MAWLKVEHETPEKPEVIAIASRLQLSPDEVFGVLFRMWRWFDVHTREGNAASVTLPLLDKLLGVTGFAEAVVSVGWLVATEKGLQLPNFDRHNGETSKARALTAKRVARNKSRGNGKGNAASVTRPLASALPREREEKEYIPPPPTPSKQSGGGGGSWGLVKERIKAAGVNDAASAVQAAVANGLTPEYVGQLIDAWASKPGAWAPGALHFRIANAVASQDPAEGWPQPKPQPKKRTQAETGQAQAFAIVKAKRAAGWTDEQILVELQAKGMEWP